MVRRLQVEVDNNISGNSPFPNDSEFIEGELMPFQAAMLFQQKHGTRLLSPG